MLISVANLGGAINLSGRAGTDYAANMSPNLVVTPFVSGSTLTVEAASTGAAGNSIAVAATGAAAWRFRNTHRRGQTPPLIAAVNTLITTDSSRQGFTAYVAAMLCSRLNLDIQNRSNQITEFHSAGSD